LDRAELTRQAEPASARLILEIQVVSLNSLGRRSPYATHLRPVIPSRVDGLHRRSIRMRYRAFRVDRRTAQMRFRFRSPRDNAGIIEVGPLESAACRRKHPHRTHWEDSSHIVFRVATLGAVGFISGPRDRLGNKPVTENAFAKSVSHGKGIPTMSGNQPQERDKNEN
jgi:hypothetical protein